MTTTAPTPPSPPDATDIYEWADEHTPDQFRLFEGTVRTVDRNSAAEPMTVAIMGSQLADGAVEERWITVHDPYDSHLTSDGARRFAAVLVEAADEVDGWAGR